MLQTDHKQIMKDIEAGLERLHSQTKQEKATAPASTPSSASTKEPTRNASHEASAEMRQPFARVDEIADTRSPAAKCGLKVGDLVIQFGSVTLQVSIIYYIIYQLSIFCCFCSDVAYFFNLKKRIPAVQRRR